MVNMVCNSHSESRRSLALAALLCQSLDMRSIFERQASGTMGGRFMGCCLVRAASARLRISNSEGKGGFFRWEVQGTVPGFASGAVTIDRIQESIKQMPPSALYMFV